MVTSLFPLRILIILCSASLDRVCYARRFLDLSHGLENDLWEKHPPLLPEHQVPHDNHQATITAVVSLSKAFGSVKGQRGTERRREGGLDLFSEVPIHQQAAKKFQEL